MMIMMVAGGGGGGREGWPCTPPPVFLPKKVKTCRLHIKVENKNSSPKAHNDVCAAR